MYGFGEVMGRELRKQSVFGKHSFLNFRKDSFNGLIKYRYRIGCYQIWSSPRGERPVSDGNLHRSSRRFQDEDLVRRNQQIRRPVPRNLDFGDEALPVTGDEARVDSVISGAVSDIRETERFGLDRSGGSGFVLARGHAGAVAASRGRRGFFRGGFRRGSGSTYQRRDGGTGFNGRDGAAGVTPENAVSPKTKPEPSTIIINAVENSLVVPAEMNDGCNEDLVRPLLDVANNSVALDSVIGKDEGAGKESLEEGEFNEVGIEDALNGELDDFAEFDAEFEFGLGDDLGNEIGDEVMIYQEDGVMDHFEEEANRFDGEFESNIEDNGTESMEVDKIMGLDEKNKADSAVPENDSVGGSDIPVTREGTKKQVRSSDPLVGANSKKHNVALLTSPRRKIPPKSGVG